jgi:hypothetical protein
VKLFGKVADVLLAIALAFRIVNGFLPVKFVYPLFTCFAVCFVSFRLPADFAPAPKTGPLSLVVDTLFFSDVVADDNEL